MAPSPPPLLTLDDLPEEAVRDRPVFVRVDFNVPMKDGAVLDASRIDAALPTVRRLLERGARPLLASHRGRPGGARVADLSLAPLVQVLADRLGTTVRFSADCVGSAARADAQRLAAGEVLLLENLRFHPGEKANDPDFVASLSQLADVYVNDAFGTAHRAHASTEGLARATPHRAAGLLLEREVRVLSGLLEAPERPFLAILGGAKIGGKLQTLERLVEEVDRLAVGGGMANTLLAASGRELGGSLVEPDLLETARTILRRCDERGVEVALPQDLVVTDSLEEPAADPRSVAVEDGISADEMAVDVGPATAERIGRMVESSRTVFWNGPLGVFESPPFDRGTLAVARALGRCPGFTAIGGGETVAAVKAAGAESGIGHVSTGGGASLELLAGEPLPGVEALRTSTRDSAARARTPEGGRTP